MSEEKSTETADETAAEAERAKKADETLRAEGIDPDSVGDITDPEQWRTMHKEGGGA